MTRAVNLLLTMAHMREALLLDKSEREQKLQVGAFVGHQQGSFRRGVHCRSLDQSPSDFRVCGGGRADETVSYESEAAEAARIVASNQAGNVFAAREHLKQARAIPAKDSGVEPQHLPLVGRGHRTDGQLR